MVLRSTYMAITAATTTHQWDEQHAGCCASDLRRENVSHHCIAERECGSYAGALKSPERHQHSNGRCKYAHYGRRHETSHADIVRQSTTKVVCGIAGKVEWNALVDCKRHVGTHMHFPNYREAFKQCIHTRALQNNGQGEPWPSFCTLNISCNE